MENKFIEKEHNLVLLENDSNNEQIETWIGETYNGEKPLEEVNGGRAKLIVMHQCPNKELLIEQLKTMINNIETDGEYFAS